MFEKGQQNVVGFEEKGWLLNGSTGIKAAKHMVWQARVRRGDYTRLVSGEITLTKSLAKLGIVLETNDIPILVKT